MEKLVQALQDDTATTKIIIAFILASTSTTFYLWLYMNELLNLKLNQITQNKNDES